MNRTFAVAACAVVAFGAPATASADPVGDQDASAFAIGKCYDPNQLRCDDRHRSHTTATTPASCRT